MPHEQRVKGLARQMRASGICESLFVLAGCLSYEVQHLALDLKVIVYCIFYDCLQKRFETNNRIHNTLSFPRSLVH